MRSISVVVPTFNRPAQLSKVLDHILRSDVDGLEKVEVIVVDDGSPESAKPVVESKAVDGPFSLKYLRQENAGPAKARNNGIRHASGNVILLIDDDVLVLPEVLKKHLEAHQDKPGSIVFGPYPYLPIDEPTTAFKYLSSLLDKEVDRPDDIKYVPIGFVASGNLSLEKAMFPSGEVYRSDLKIPAAEEFEFEHRLNTAGVPIFMVPEAKGWHLQPPTIDDKCKQEFKYGVGAAEVWLKVPNIINNQHISGFIVENGFIDWSNDSRGLKTKKFLKSILAANLVRTVALRCIKVLERVTTSNWLLFPMYRYLCGINLFAGVRHGLREFGRR